MNNKTRGKLLSYPTIVLAAGGETEAISIVVNLYMPYIRTLSRGNKDITDRLIAKLITVVLRFKLDYGR